MDIRQFAKKILFANSIDEKLFSPSEFSLVTTLNLLLFLHTPQDLLSFPYLIIR